MCCFSILRYRACTASTSSASFEQKITKVIVLTMHRDEASVMESLRLGAKGYVVKNSPTSELLAAIRAVTRENEIFASSEFHPMVHRAAFDMLTGQDERVRRQVTPQEQIVLRLCANGKRNGQIAEELGISIRTAEKHRANVMRKLELHHQGE